jgi:hypothetical protein
MKKFGLFFLSFALAITTSCGQGGKSQNSGQVAQAPEQQDPQRPGGPGGQGGPGGRMQFNPEDMAKRQTEQIGEYVKYTEGQAAKVTEINLKYAQKMREMRGEPGNFRDMTDAQRQEFRKKMDEMNTQKDGELKKLFTADQYKQYEVFKEEQAKMRRERMMQGGGGRP